MSLSSWWRKGRRVTVAHFEDSAVYDPQPTTHASDASVSSQAMTPIDPTQIRKELEERVDYPKLEVLFCDGGQGIEENLLHPAMRPAPLLRPNSCKDYSHPTGGFGKEGSREAKEKEERKEKGRIDAGERSWVHGKGGGDVSAAWSGQYKYDAIPAIDEGGKAKLNICNDCYVCRPYCQCSPLFCLWFLVCSLLNGIRYVINFKILTNLFNNFFPFFLRYIFFIVRGHPILDRSRVYHSAWGAGEHFYLQCQCVVTFNVLILVPPKTFH